MDDKLLQAKIDAAEAGDESLFEQSYFDDTIEKQKIKTDSLKSFTNIFKFDQDVDEKEPKMIKREPKNPIKSLQSLSVMESPQMSKNYKKMGILKSPDQKPLAGQLTETKKLGLKKSKTLKSISFLNIEEIGEMRNRKHSMDIRRSGLL